MQAIIIIIISYLLRKHDCILCLLLIKRSLLRLAVLLRSWHFNTLWMIHSLIIQKSYLWMLKGTSGLMKVVFIPDLATNCAVDWIFFFYRYCPSVHLFSGYQGSSCLHPLWVQAPGSHCGYCLTTRSVDRDLRLSMKVRQLSYHLFCVTWKITMLLSFPQDSLFCHRNIATV